MRRAEKFKKPFAVWLTALAVCVIIAAIPLFSSAYVFFHANHAHDRNGSDGGCAACARVASFAKRGALADSPGAPRVFWKLSAALAALKPAGARADFCTLICLKVRLNN